MDREHIHWLMEMAHKHQEHIIGAITTVLVLLAAYSTLNGHLAHTEEVKAQALAVDQWGFYQAKHIRAHMYAIEADKAWASGNEKLARRYLGKAIYEQCGEVPLAAACHIEMCMSSALPVPAKQCAVPVLKDSPELQSFYRNIYTRDLIVAADSSRFPRPVDGAPSAEQRSAAQVYRKDRTPGAVELVSLSREREENVEHYKTIAERFDYSEIFFEVSLMLCGFALIIGTKAYWRFSYSILSLAVCISIAGIACGVSGWFLSHAPHR